MSKRFALLLVLALLTASCLTTAKLGLSSAGVVENSWVSKASMNEERRDFGVALVNGKIYVIGGTTRSGGGGTLNGPLPVTGGTVGTNEEYDPATNAWTLKTPMTWTFNYLNPTPLDSFSTTVCQNKIYCIGSEVNEEYDPAKDRWTTKTPMPTPTSSFDIVVCQNKIYCISSEVNAEYNPATDTWTIKASIPTPRSDIRAYVVDGKIYVIGGDSLSGTLNEAYDPATDSWSRKAPMPTEAYDISAVVDNKIYVIASYLNKSLNQIYDPETDMWHLGTSLPLLVGQYGQIAATTGVEAPTRIYVLSIARGLYELPDSIQVYNPENDSWTFGAKVTIDSNYFSVAVVNDLLYAFGGWTTYYPDMPFSYPYGPTLKLHSTNVQYTPFGYGTVPPKIAVVSLGKRDYTLSNVSLAFTVNKPAVWMGYSIDGRDNVTVTGNVTLAGLAIGLHNITVYAKDEFENIGTSETVTFTIAKEPEPFPTMWVVVVSGASVLIIGASLIVYFKKRKR